MYFHRNCFWYRVWKSLKAKRSICPRKVALWKSFSNVWLRSIRRNGDHRETDVSCVFAVKLHNRDETPWLIGNRGDRRHWDPSFYQHSYKLWLSAVYFFTKIKCFFDYSILHRSSNLWSKSRFLTNAMEDEICKGESRLARSVHGNTEAKISNDRRSVCGLASKTWLVWRESANREVNVLERTPY